ncbi:MAG: DUF4956 domain-containing protein [Melioribacteraceae bacterium]
MQSFEILKILESLHFEIREALLSLTATLLLSLIVVWVYSNTHKRKGYSKEFIQTLVFISEVVCSIMLVIGNNLAGAFGLIGAVSIIRFRTKVKNPQDITYIFFVMAIGVACGFKYFYVAVISTLFISGILLIFWKFNFIEENPLCKIYILRVLVPELSDGKTLIEKFLNDQVIDWDIVNLRNNQDNNLIIDYRIKLSTNIPTKIFLSYFFNNDKQNFTILEFKSA